MAEQDFDRMDELDFDTLLMDSLPDLPEPEMVRRVNSWRTAMNRILIGLCLISVTLNFWKFQYILPPVGWVLMLLGFRRMRKENRWFGLCYGITILWTAHWVMNLILNTMVLRGEIVSSAPARLVFTSLMLLQVVLYAAFWLGLRQVGKKTGMNLKTRSAGMLVIWYVLLLCMAFNGLGSSFTGFLMLVVYGIIIYNLHKLSSVLDQAGYAIESAPIRLSDRVVVSLLAIVVAVGMGCGYLFGGQYPMNWTERVPTENAQVSAVKEELLALDFPEDVLNDLTDQEILALKGTRRVLKGTNQQPVNDGRRIREIRRDEFQREEIVEEVVYDAKELRVTGVAVLLPGEPERWQIIHHFYWQTDPGYWGTESLQLWPIERTCGSSWWCSDGEVTGRVLVERDGKSYEAPYYAFGPKTYTSNTMWGGEQTSEDVFAEFSLPRDGENGRAYLTYPIAQLQEGCIVDSWVNYTHQTNAVQFPVVTAAEKRMKNGWSRADVFRTIESAVQFYPPFQDGPYLKGSEEKGA